MQRSTGSVRLAVELQQLAVRLRQLVRAGARHDAHKVAQLRLVVERGQRHAVLARLLQRAARGGRPGHAAEGAAPAVGAVGAHRARHEHRLAAARREARREVDVAVGAAGAAKGDVILALRDAGLGRGQAVLACATREVTMSGALI